MLIIVEGPNGAGKSTLVHRLLDEIKREDPRGLVSRVHKGAPTEHPLSEYERPLLGYRPGRDEHLVLERWHLGEYVYPGVLGRPTQLTLAVRRHIDLFLRSRGALLVHVTAPDDVIARRFTQRGREHWQIDVRMIPAIAAGFRDAYLQSTLWRHEVTDVLADGVAWYVVYLARLAEERTMNLNPFITYVGPPTPKFLLLGDVRSGRWSNGNDPAFGPYPGTSGAFLLEHLRLDVRHIGIANACDVDDAAHLAFTLHRHSETGRGPRVVTLGRRAERCTREWLDNPATVPHPQYVRRFFNSRGPEYGEMINAVANGGYHGEVWWHH